MKLLLFLMLVVAIGAIWETRRNRRMTMLPLLGVCVFVAFAYYAFLSLL